MATAAEVESIVVRLTGDGSQYQQMMQQAQKYTSQTGQHIGAIAHDVDGFGKKLTRFGELAVAALGINAIKNFLRETIHSWTEQEDALIKTEAILKTNGREVQKTLDDYNEFASAIQKVTTQGDEVTLGILAMAESFGLTGEAAKEATKNAIGFAAINGGSANQYLRFTAAMAQGDTEKMKMMARMIPQLRGIRNEQELIQKATLLAATGFETAQKMAQTYTGQMAQLKNAWGDIMEDVGKTVTELLIPAVQQIRRLVDWIQSLSPETKRFATIFAAALVVIASIGPITAAAGATIIPLLRMMADGFQLIGMAVKLLFSPLALLRGLLIGIGIVAGYVFSPIGIIIGLAAIAIGVFISRMGGIEKAMHAVSRWAEVAWGYVKDAAGVAWEWIKTKAESFWTYIRPAVMAFVGYATAGWELVSYAAGVAWDFIADRATEFWNWITEVWTGIAGDAQINWESIRDFIRDSFIYAEFVLRNFRESMEILWLAVRLGWSVAVDQFRGGLMLMWTAIQAFVRQATRSFAALWDVVTGRATISQAFSRIVQAHGDMLRQINQQMSDNTSQETRDLGEQLRARARGFVERMEEFRRRRIAEIDQANTEETLDERRNDRQRNNHNERMQEIQRIDAALVGSAEAQSRLLNFQEFVRRQRSGEQSPNQPAPNSPAAATRGAEAQARMLLPVLNQIQQNTARVANNPPIEIDVGDGAHL